MISELTTEARVLWVELVALTAGLAAVGLSGISG